MKKKLVALLLSTGMLVSAFPVAGAETPGLTGSISGETFDAASTAETAVLTETSESPSNAADFTSVRVQADANETLVYKNIDFTGAKVLLMEAAIDDGSTGKEIALYIDSVEEANRIGTLTTRSTAKVSDLDFNEQYADMTATVTGAHDLILQFTDTTALELDFLNLTSYIGTETEEERDARMEWWRDAKFGQFIHFGAYSYLGGYYNGNKTPGYSEWIMSNMGIGKEEYAQNVAAKFNPTSFDAEKIVSDAKAAGQKYLIITSRHHEGFSIFDTQIRNYRDYSLFSYAEQSGYSGGDILKELAAECQKQGIVFGVYSTIMDWHDPSQSNMGGSITEGYTKEAYKAQLKGQVKELIEEYGVKVFFFDGEWVGWWTKEDGQELYRYILSLDETCIVNNRVGKRHADDGDYGTPEQEVPATGLDYDWESCVTMNNNWGYCQGDNNWKSPQWIIDNVVDIASKGGNLLLNVGPDGDGVVEQAPIDNMSAAGAWLEQFGDAIYGTRASCFASGVPSNVRITTKPEGKVYAIVLRDDPAAIGSLKLPALANEILSVKEMATGTEIPYQVMGDQMYLTISGTAKQEYATVYEITVDGVPEAAQSAEDPRENFAKDAATTVSTAYSAQYDGPNLVDGATDSNSGRWAPTDEDPAPWVTIDLGQSRQFSEIVMYEWWDTFYDRNYRCQSFKISVSDDNEQWREIYTGTAIGERLSILLEEPVTAKYIKIHDIVGTSSGNVSLHEVQVYEAPLQKSEIAITSNVQLVGTAPFTIGGTYDNGTSVEVNVWGPSFTAFTVPATVNAEEGTWTATIDGDSLQAGDLVLTAYLKNEDQTVAMDVCNVTYTGRENLAAGKTFTASSVYVDNPPSDRDFSAYKLGDGILTGGNERWAPDDAVDDSPWAYVDLGETRTVSEVVLYEWLDTYFGNVYRCSSFQISVSNDAQQWETVHTGTTIGKELHVVLEESVQARYVKVENLVGTENGNVSLHEMAVYGEEIQQYTVTFETNGGSTVEPMVVESGAVIDLPIPTKPEFAFAGWYTDAELQTAFDAKTPITGDITLYAKWVAVEDVDSHATVSIVNTNNKVNGRGVFEVQLDEARGIALVEVTFTASSDDVVIDGANGFVYLDTETVTLANGTVQKTATFCYLPEEQGGVNFDCDAATAIASIAVAGQNSQITLDKIIVAGYDEAGEPQYGTATIVVDGASYCVYDVCADGVVDLLDIVAVQKYYQTDSSDEAAWAKASRCDVNEDKVVNLQDLVEILVNYTKTNG